MIELQHVSKSFDGWQAVDRLSLTIDRGEFFVIVGSSGSGKSTTLKMINRLIDHDAGEILFAGAPVRSLPAVQLRRRIGYAIQSIGLFPHWTVARNVAAVPELLNWPAARIRERVTQLLELVGLDPVDHRERYPHQLSGGEQQRVGVARALAGDPEVLLMDEPFGALDPLTRATLQRELARIHRASAKTIVLVTHDVDEALLLGNRVALLDRGRLVQCDTPRRLLREPANALVEQFIGGADRGIKLLGSLTVAERMHRDETADGVSIAAGASLREALSLFAVHRVERLAVLDDRGLCIGALHRDDLLRPSDAA